MWTFLAMEVLVTIRLDTQTLGQNARKFGSYRQAYAIINALLELVYSSFSLGPKASWQCDASDVLVTFLLAQHQWSSQLSTWQDMAVKTSCTDMTPVKPATSLNRCNLSQRFSTPFSATYTLNPFWTASHQPLHIAMCFAVHTPQIYDEHPSRLILLHEQKC